MEKIVCVSGGFDPLHIGHLEMFRQAANYGNLVVILNSDDWLIRKKGFVFLPWEQRAEIIRELKMVRSVIAVDDTDGTVCEALRRFKPDMFANGGDRKLENTPEHQICLDLGIQELWNIGGEKADNSSAIAKKAWVTRKWGKYVALDEGVGYKVKRLVLEPGKGISKQFHNSRQEDWKIVNGEAIVKIGSYERKANSDDPVITVPAGAIHQITNCGTKPLEIIEIQSGEYLGEDDITRLEE